MTDTDDNAADFALTCATPGLATDDALAPPCPLAWDEAADGGGDTGQLPFEGTTQDLSGGNYGDITGDIAVEDDVDLYRIYIADPAAFTANTSAFTAPDDLGDTQLFLFDALGFLVDEDDQGGTGSRSALPTAGDRVTQAGIYYLAVSAWNNDPTDPSGDGMFDPGDGPVTGWASSFQTAGTYGIEVTGLGVAPPAAPVVSEIDVDQEGADDAEFVEIANAGGFAFDLGAYRLDFVDAAGSVYQSLTLPPRTLLGGGATLFVACADAREVPACNAELLPTADLLANGGPAAVALVEEATGTVVDVVSYGGTTPGGFVEGTGTGADDPSAAFATLARDASLTDTDDNAADFAARCRTPGTANGSAGVPPCAAPPPVVRNVTAGADFDVVQAALDAATPGDVLAFNDTTVVVQPTLPVPVDFTAFGGPATTLTLQAVEVDETNAAYDALTLLVPPSVTDAVAASGTLTLADVTFTFEAGGASVTRTLADLAALDDPAGGTLRATLTALTPAPGDAWSLSVDAGGAPVGSAAAPLYGGLVVAKALTLEGAQAGVPVAGTSDVPRGGETILQGTLGAVVAVTASNVTLDGLVLEGDDGLDLVTAGNAAATDARPRYGVLIDETANGGALSNVTVQYTWIRHLTSVVPPGAHKLGPDARPAGILVAGSGGTGAAGTGLLFADNRIEGILTAEAGPGAGVRLTGGAVAEVRTSLLGGPNRNGFPIGNTFGAPPPPRSKAGSQAAAPRRDAPRRAFARAGGSTGGLKALTATDSLGIGVELTELTRDGAVTVTGNTIIFGDLGVLVDGATSGAVTLDVSSNFILQVVPGGPILGQVAPESHAKTARGDGTAGGAATGGKALPSVREVGVLAQHLDTRTLTPTFTDNILFVVASSGSGGIEELVPSEGGARTGAKFSEPGFIGYYLWDVQGTADAPLTISGGTVDGPTAGVLVTDVPPTAADAPAPTTGVVIRDISMFSSSFVFASVQNGVVVESVGSGTGDDAEPVDVLEVSGLSVDHSFATTGLRLIGGGASVLSYGNNQATSSFDPFVITYEGTPALGDASIDSDTEFQTPGTNSLTGGSRGSARKAMARGGKAARGKATARGGKATTDELRILGELALAPGVSILGLTEPINVGQVTPGTPGLGNDAGWRILGVPGAAPNTRALADDVTFATLGGDVAFTWDATAASFTPADDNTPLDAGQGFFLYFFDDRVDPVEPATPLTLDRLGELTVGTAFPSDGFGTGSVSITLPNGGGERFHLLANPYIQSYDLGSLDLAALGFTNVVQVWDATLGSYVTRTQGTLDSDSDGVQDDVIAPWQGFFAERATPGAGGTTLTFDEAGRTTGGAYVGEGSALRATDAAAALALPLRLEATARGRTYRDHAATLFFSDDAAPGFDGYDATKLAPPFATRSATLAVRGLGPDGQPARLAQASRPVPRDAPATFDLDFVATDLPAGTATLTLPADAPLPGGWQILGTDLATGATFTLAPGTSYTFAFASTEADDATAARPGQPAALRADGRRASGRRTEGRRAAPRGDLAQDDAVARDAAASRDAAARRASQAGATGATTGRTPPPLGDLLALQRGLGAKAAAAPRFRLVVGPTEVLPVELAALTARADGADAVLTWRTVSETNNAGFAVEHRAPGQTAFARLGFVDGAGTTTEAQTYTFRARQVGYGTHAFRLRQLDFDGTTAVTTPVELTAALDAPYALDAYPNPVTTRATVEVAVRTAQDVRVALYDVLGRRVATLHDGPLTPHTSHRLALPAAGLASGVYVVRVTGERFQATRRVTVVR